MCSCECKWVTRINLRINGRRLYLCTYLPQRPTQRGFVLSLAVASALSNKVGAGCCPFLWPWHCGLNMQALSPASANAQPLVPYLSSAFAPVLVSSPRRVVWSSHPSKSGG